MLDGDPDAVGDTGMYAVGDGRPDSVARSGDEGNVRAE